jgi:hypothetical protein
MFRSFYVILLTLLLFACQNTVERKGSASITEFEQSISYFPAQCDWATQVFNNSVHFISDYKTLYRIDGDELVEIYSLNDRKVLEMMVEKVLHNEHSYPFMLNKEEPFEHSFIDQFYITSEYIYLSVRALMPYLGDYEGREAQMNLPQRTILKISATTKEVEDVHSIMVSLDEFKNRNSNQADMQRGFVILNNECGYVGNLTFTFEKSEIAELLRINDLDSFKWSLQPLVYYDEIPEQQLTNTRSYFHGESRKRFCGTFGCVEFKNDTFELLVKNPISTRTGKSIVFGMSDVWFEDQNSYALRSVFNESKKMISLELVQNNDSVIHSQEIRDISNFRSLDFIDKSAWYIWADTLSDGFYLHRYSLVQ